MKNFAILFIILITACALTEKNIIDSSFKTCSEDKNKLEARSNELASIAQADQDERKNWNQKSSKEIMIVVGRDSLRRQRIGEIFEEGCFSKAEDYSAAALVYQHGSAPEHLLSN